MRHLQYVQNNTDITHGSSIGTGIGLLTKGKRIVLLAIGTGIGLLAI